MQILNLRTDAGDLDLTFAVAGFSSGYDELVPNAISAEIGAVTVKIADLSDVIRSKSAAARAKDLDALPELNNPAQNGATESVNSRDGTTTSTTTLASNSR